MQQPLKFGVSAVTADGRDVGSLYRVVIDEGSSTVTAVTVRRRLLESGNLLKPGGWDAPRDLRVPFTQVTGGDDDEIRLSLTEEEFLALPPYILGATPETAANLDAPPGVTRQFQAQDVALEVNAALGGGAYVRPSDEQENRTPTERHLSHETNVWQHTPSVHVGALDAVLMDDVSNAVEGLVVRRGVLFTHEVLVPVESVVDLLDDLVHVTIPGGDVQALAPYHVS